MLLYNTQLKPLKLPEYGRNIQQMVDHCLTIEDREERTRCARSIIKSMSNLFPELAASEESAHKLWDHLAIMSDFKLDIDYPCEIVNPDDFSTKPQKLELPGHDGFARHYGVNILKMIDAAAAMEPGEERNSLVLLIANQMKKQLLIDSPEGINDTRVFKDLEHLSHGEIKLNPEEVKLCNYEIVTPSKNSKKKKKK